VAADVVWRLSEEEDTQKDRYLTFMVDGEGYGIEIRYVTEIIGMQPITPVPDMPPSFRGIINLRGTVIPVMDMRQRFKRAPAPYTDRTCIVVADVSGVAMGLAVDAVSDVLHIEAAAVTEPPATLLSPDNRYIQGIGRVQEGVRLLLDCGRLLQPQELDRIETISQEGTHEGLL